MVNGFSEESELLFMPGHSKSYLKADAFAEEFFANLFEIKVVGNEKTLGVIREFMPKSYEAFEELLSLRLSED